MCKHFVPAALALLVLNAGAAAANPAPHAPASGLTTLKSQYSNAPDGFQLPAGDASGPSFTSVTVIQDGGASSTVEPLPVFGDDAAARPAPEQRTADRGTGALGVAHLPEPSTWVLLLIGLAMIGFALRGLIAANRRLARLGAAEEV